MLQDPVTLLEARFLGTLLVRGEGKEIQRYIKLRFLVNTKTEMLKNVIK